MTAARVVIVGGGIGGVTAAYEIGRRLPDVEVLVLEASDRVGGKLRTGPVGDVVTDLGAEAMLNRRPEAVDLARAVGLGDRLVHPTSTSAAIWTRGAVRRMPPTVMGVPADADALVRSGLLSRAGAARARLETGRKAPTCDIAVGAFVRGRLGREVVERLVEPLLGGVYAGHASALSLFAAAPQIAALARRGSLLEAARTDREGGTRDDIPVFAGLVGGVGLLPVAIADASGAGVRLRTTVREVARTEEGRWRIVVGPTAAPELIEADAVVVATPAAPTARLLAPVVPLAARSLRQIEYASMAVISLAVAVSPDQAARLDGSGFLVPPVDGRTIKAATYSSRKWQWIADTAPDDVLVLRTSIGRAGEEELLQRDESDLVQLAMADLSAAVGLRGPLRGTHVQRWGGALPQYAVGHLDRVAAIESAVAAVPGVELCGAAYHGIGIPAVIADAQAAAARVVDHLVAPAGGARQ